MMPLIFAGPNESMEFALIRRTLCQPTEVGTRQIAKLQPHLYTKWGGSIRHTLKEI
jgi:hypothetical protein